MNQSYSTINCDELKQKLNANPPDNNNRQQGYALVNVLSDWKEAGNEVTKS